MPDLQRFLMSGVWTWFNNPLAVRDTTNSVLYFGAIDNTGQPIVVGWDEINQLGYVGRPHPSVINRDDHDNPGLCVLDDKTLLACYSEHPGSSWANRTTTPGDVRTFGSPVTVNNAGMTSNNEAYALVWQANDTAKTVYWIFRRNQTARWIRASTDRGATWGTAIEFVENGSNRPYMVVCPGATANRLDICVMDAHPAELNNNSVYHFYMTVASDGTRSYFKTDGTSLGGDGALPFTPASDLTLVWDGNGTDNNSWNWDIAVIGGNPVIAFATFSDDFIVHTYHQARWSGSAWVTEPVSDGGSVTPNWLFDNFPLEDPTSSEPQYSGGIGLDPNDINVVYVSRKYGANDYRIEKYTHSGTFGSGSWSKTTDVSGNTGTTNARPWCERTTTPTRVSWWEGLYLSYNTYITIGRCDPPLEWRGAKEASPVWNADLGPEGTQAYYLLNEGSGSPADLTGTYNGTNVGTPPWGDGDFGKMLTGLDTSNYIQIDAVAAAFAAISNTTFPQWMVVLYKSSSSGNKFAAALGSHSSNSPVFSLSLNIDTEVVAFARDDSNTGGQVGNGGGGGGGFDDVLHVMQFLRRTGGDGYLYVDGYSLQVGAPTATGGQMTTDRGAIGCLVRSGGPEQQFSGIVHAVIFGWGAEPDPVGLAADLLNGQFSGSFDIIPRLTSSVVSWVSSSSTDVILTATAATGGTEPYSYQWERSLSGADFVELVGETTLDLDDAAASLDTQYAWRLKTTDDDGTIVYSNVLETLYFYRIKATAGVVTSDPSFVVAYLG